MPSSPLVPHLLLHHHCLGRLQLGGQLSALGSCRLQQLRRVRALSCRLGAWLRAQQSAQGRAARVSSCLSAGMHHGRVWMLQCARRRHPHASPRLKSRVHLCMHTCTSSSERRPLAVASAVVSWSTCRAGVRQQMLSKGNCGGKHMHAHPVAPTLARARVSWSSAWLCCCSERRSCTSSTHACGRVHAQQQELMRASMRTLAG